MINILVIAIHLVENNDSLYLAVLNNNNIERTFGLIKNIASTTDNHQYMYKAVQDLLLYKYLKFLEGDFKLKNNFREGYCNTLTGNLDNSTKQYDKIKHLARSIY